MKLLALETATASCGVAVWDTAAARAAVRREQVTTHSERLIQIIAECLDELGLKPADLDGVGCGAGPGSFTGLRIGAATAKGLCFALDRPLFMISSLLVLAASIPTQLCEPDARAAVALPHARPVLAVLDAFRGQVFARLVPPTPTLTSGTTQWPAPLAAIVAAHPLLARDGAWDPLQLAEILAPAAARIELCGSGVPRLPASLVAASARSESVSGPRDSLPHPLALARLALLRLQAGESSPLESAAPNYLIPSAAEVNTGKLDPAASSAL